MVRGLLGENALVSCPIGKLLHIQIIYLPILEIIDLLMLPHAQTVSKVFMYFTHLPSSFSGIQCVQVCV